MWHVVNGVCVDVHLLIGLVVYPGMNLCFNTSHHTPEVMRPLAAITSMAWGGGMVELGRSSEAVASSCEALSAAND